MRHKNQQDLSKERRPRTSRKAETELMAQLRAYMRACHQARKNGLPMPLKAEFVTVQI